MPPRPKHVPQRTCIACRQEKAKRELVRIVRSPAGSVAVDLTGKRSGRGAYLCMEPVCWHKGLAGKMLEAALKAPLPLEDLETLRAFARALEDPSIPPSVVGLPQRSGHSS